MCGNLFWIMLDCPYGPTQNPENSQFSATFKKDEDQTIRVLFHIKRIWIGRLWGRHVALYRITFNITNSDRLWSITKMQDTITLCDSIQHADMKGDHLLSIDNSLSDH